MVLLNMVPNSRYETIPKVKYFCFDPCCATASTKSWEGLNLSAWNMPEDMHCYGRVLLNSQVWYLKPSLLNSRRDCEKIMVFLKQLDWRVDKLNRFWSSSIACEAALIQDVDF